MTTIPLSEALKLMQYISDAIGTIRDPQELFRTLTDKLRLIFPFDSAVIITLDRDRRRVNVFFEMLRFELPEHLKVQQRPLAGTWIEDHLDDRAVTVASIARDIPAFGEEDAPLLRTLHELGMRQIVLSPLRSGGRVIGFLSFVSREEKLWSDGDKSLLSGVSSSIAIAVSNALAYDELRQREAETAMQLAINNALFTTKDRSQMLLTVCEQISRLVPCSFLGIRVVGSDGRFRIYDNFMRGSG
ncbi:MAG TPA: GAF domain-containing protein, partial [Chlorobaculum parvum]|nr:GAF domain-containing protein [Chlorobaculum parvum]